MKYTEAMQMRKQGGIYGDISREMLGAAGANALTGGYLGSAVGNLGHIAGAIAETEPTTGNINYIPGVGGYNVEQQRKKLSEDLGNKHPVATALSEQFGNSTANILPAAALGIPGALIGAQLSDKFVADGDRTVGGLLGGIGGAAIGMSAGPLVGSLLALARRRRTTEEQQAYEHGSKAMNWLIPGAALYNRYKTYGYMHGQEQKAKAETKKNEGEKKENKEQKKEASLRKQAQPEQPTPYGNARSAISAVAGSPMTEWATKRVVDSALASLQKYQHSRDMMQRARFYDGLTAGVGVGGLTTAGAYGLTGLVPGLKNNKLLRWLLAGTAGGVAGLQAGRLGADLGAQRPQEV